MQGKSIVKNSVKILLCILLFLVLMQGVQAAPDSLANPASVNCGKVGATSEIMNNPDGSQYGMCKFPNGTACEEWALFRGEGCKPNVAPVTTIPSTPTILQTTIKTATPTSTTDNDAKIAALEKQIAEQNKKIDEQGNVLDQITNFLRNIFGWNIVKPTPIPVTSPTPTSNPVPTTIPSVTPTSTPQIIDITATPTQIPVTSPTLTSTPTPKPIPEPTTQMTSIITPTIPPTVVTTLSSNAPTVSSISPTSGAKDAIVGVTITGTNFESGATAKLTRAGYPSITATGVSVYSATAIGCAFKLGGDLGSYNVMVTNPSGQSNTKMAAFSIDEAPQIVSTTMLVTPTPTLTPNPTPVTTTLATLTPVPIPTTEFIQVMPNDQQVNVLLTKDRPTSEIHLQYQGGPGERFTNKILMRVYASDGTYTEYVMSNGNKPLPGDEIIVPGTKGNDRCEVFVISAGVRYKVLDEAAIGGGYY